MYTFRVSPTSGSSTWPRVKSDADHYHISILAKLLLLLSDTVRNHSLGLLGWMPLLSYDGQVLVPLLEFCLETKDFGLIQLTPYPGSTNESMLLPT